MARPRSCRWKFRLQQHPGPEKPRTVHPQPRLPCLTLLGRFECGLCDEMAFEFHEWSSLRSVPFDRADVDSNPDWQRRFGLRVPVILDSWGEVVCEGRFDVQALDGWMIERRRHGGT